MTTIYEIEFNRIYSVFHDKIVDQPSRILVFYDLSRWLEKMKH